MSRALEGARNPGQYAIGMAGAIPADPHGLRHCAHATPTQWPNSPIVGSLFDGQAKASTDGIQARHEGLITARQFPAVSTPN